MMDNIDKDIIVYLSQDIEVTKDIYEDLSKKFNISEEDLIKRLKRLNESGYLKRIAPVMIHQKSGYNSNAMAVWNIPKDNLKKFIDIIKGINNISHIYERRTDEKWPYNLYTMIHGRNKKEVENIINYLLQKIEVKDFKVLYTIKEWKKTSPNLSKLIKK
ncbi:DNA-binding transcriptional regulator, Lrp family [Tepidibacter thalassicus DSM 15285]|uniref:DNA-binding transcriptional regulator, Lrp family n=2 Tax=Tepidibacter TaxID=214904 RepID=A0A1M5SP40_9FIRM|nr:DNA-binding transcriptional regulator, Lrp family [Tepidibacter thalassicus DSM 15285]